MAKAPPFTFYRDTLDDTLFRIGPAGTPDVMHTDGTWHPYPDANLQTEAMPITEKGARALAGKADLTAAASATPSRRRGRAPARSA